MVNTLLRRAVFTLLVFVGAGVVVALALSFVPDQTDASVLGRWGRYLQTMVTFDYGEGPRNIIESVDAPILVLLTARGLTTLTLIGGALSLLVVVGVPLGVARAFHPDSRLLRVTASATHALSSIPILVWAFGLLVFSTAVFGTAPTFNSLPDAEGWKTVLIYAVPIISLGLGDGLLSDVVRRVRSETEEEIGKTYVRALRARRVSALKHVLRGAVGSICSTISNKISYLISGTIVVEYVFSARGLAYEVYRAIEQTKEYDVVLAATLLFVGITVLLNFVSELIALTADPRLQKA